jgi:hypothetical protein
VNAFPSSADGLAVDPGAPERRYGHAEAVAADRGSST